METFSNLGNTNSPSSKLPLRAKMQSYLHFNQTTISGSMLCRVSGNSFRTRFWDTVRLTSCRPFKCIRISNVSFTNRWIKQMHTKAKYLKTPRSTDYSALRRGSCMSVTLRRSLQKGMLSPPQIPILESKLFQRCLQEKKNGTAVFNDKHCEHILNRNNNDAYKG